VTTARAWRLSSEFQISASAFFAADCADFGRAARRRTSGFSPTSLAERSGTHGRESHVTPCRLVRPDECRPDAPGANSACFTTLGRRRPFQSRLAQ
jgi:hypothetical protein